MIKLTWEDEDWRTFGWTWGRDWSKNDPLQLVTKFWATVMGSHNFFMILIIKDEKIGYWRKVNFMKVYDFNKGSIWKSNRHIGEGILWERFEVFSKMGLKD